MRVNVSVCVHVRARVCVFVCVCAPFVALRHVACLVAAIWLHAIRVPPSKALALANMAGEERRRRGLVGAM